MPEDNLFPAGTQSTTDDPPKNDPDPKVTTDTPPSLTAEAVAAIVEKSVSTQVGPIQKSVNDMGEFFTYLQEQTKTPPDTNGNDLSTKLYADPEGVIQEEFAKHATPLVQAQASSMSEFILKEQQERVEETWGAGAWDKVYAPEMKATMERVSKTNPMAIMNREAVTNAVDTLTGRNTDALIAHQKEWQESRDKKDTDNVQKLTDAVISQTNLVGGIRRSGATKPTLGPEHDESLDAFFRATGTKPDREELATMMGIGSEVGTTIDEYRATQKGNK